MAVYLIFRENILKLNALRSKFRFAVENNDFAGKTSKRCG